MTVAEIQKISFIFPKLFELRYRAVSQISTITHYAHCLYVSMNIYNVNKRLASHSPTSNWARKK